MLAVGSHISSARVLVPALSRWSLGRIGWEITSVFATCSPWRAGACCGWSELDDHLGLSVAAHSGSILFC